MLSMRFNFLNICIKSYAKYFLAHSFDFLVIGYIWVYYYLYFHEIEFLKQCKCLEVDDNCK